MKTYQKYLESIKTPVIVNDFQEFNCKRHDVWLKINKNNMKIKELQKDNYELQSEMNSIKYNPQISPNTNSTTPKK